MARKVFGHATIMPPPLDTSRSEGATVRMAKNAYYRSKNYST